MTASAEQMQNRAKWRAALLSGEYQQTQHSLRNGQGFCCLGVAADALGLGYWIDLVDREGEYGLVPADSNDPERDRAISLLPNTMFFDTFGFTDQAPFFEANDMLRSSFKSIAMDLVSDDPDVTLPDVTLPVPEDL